MNLRDYVRAIRDFWRSVVVVILLCVGGAAIATLSQTPEYQASVRLFISTQSSLSDISQTYQGGLFTQQRVKSYASIVGSESVMNAVIRDVRLNITPKDLAKKVHATAPLDTVLINVSVRDRSPVQAQAIANAVGERFRLFVNQIETPEAGQASPVKVSVVQPASLPTAAASPKKVANFALGALVGLFAGLLQAVLRSSLDTTVKGAKDVVNILPAPIVGLIPFDPEASGHPVITDSSPHSLRSEAFRQLRTNLQFVDIDNPPKSIVITSSVPKEGKSTSTANLAVTMARAGLRVVVIEADLRRPRLMSYLGIPGKPIGLTDVLIGRVPVSQALSSNGPGGIAFLPSGTTPPNPSELLASAAMQRVIAELEATFDVVLIDAPPLLPVTDAAVLSVLSDGVLLVVRTGSTKREQLSRSRDLLAAVDARILGVVMNRVDRKSRESYGYYYYYSSDGGDRKRRNLKANEPIFTPDPLVPATRPERKTSATKVDETGPIPLPAKRAIPAPSATGAGERADSVRAAVLQAFARGAQPTAEPDAKDQA